MATPRVPARLGGVALALGVLVGGAGCSGDDDGDAVAFCQRLTALPANPLADVDQNDDDAVAAALTDVLVVQRGLREVAPGDVRSDLDELIEFSEQIIAVRQAGDPVPDAVVDRYGEIADASARLAAYADEQCPPE